MFLRDIVEGETNHLLFHANDDPLALTSSSRAKYYGKGERIIYKHKELHYASAS